jgi:probable dihydroxyacetone kinase regulator
MSDSINTKKAIAMGFKELMHQKSFDKITIADIAGACGLNRQTFYYHFRDKYDLLDWIYYNEAIHYMIEGITFDNWSDRLYAMLKDMKNDGYFYINAFKASGSAEFENYLTRAFEDLFLEIISSYFRDGGIDRDDEAFIASFYAYGLVGIIVNWTLEGMQETPEELKGRFENLVYGTKRFSVNRFLTENRRGE